MCWPKVLAENFLLPPPARKSQHAIEGVERVANSFTSRRPAPGNVTLRFREIDILCCRLVAERLLDNLVAIATRLTFAEVHDGKA
jgi:hypothetical protein